MVESEASDAAREMKERMQRDHLMLLDAEM